MEQKTVFTPEDWSAFLSDAVGRAVQVEFGRARRHVLVVDTDAQKTRVRMHGRFAHAPGEVREALAAWMRAGRRARRASALLDAWIEELAESFAREDRARPRLCTRGRTHDLLALREELWGNVIAVAPPRSPAPPDITWGRRSGSRARHSLQLGSFDERTRLVRIHPVLDQPAVPGFFVRSVLHHELLHAALPPVTDARGRRRHHGPHFRRLEADFPAHRRAVAWQEENLPALLRSARTGDPLPAPRPRAPRQGTQGLLFPLQEPGDDGGLRSPATPPNPSHSSR